MTAFSAAQDRDANSQVISSNESFKLESTWTFSTLTTGAVGAHTLFTVTGNVIVMTFGICDTNLAGAATFDIGVTGNTQGFCQIADATEIDDGDVFTDGNPAVGTDAVPSTQIINDGLDIILTIGSTPITAGVIDFYCLWRPLSSDGNVTATTPA